MKASNFNNFKEYKDIKIPKGKTVVFKVQGIKKDPDNPKRVIIPRVTVRPTDFISDSEGNTHHIAYIEGESPDGDARFGELNFTPEAGGVIRCKSGNAKDEEKYKFLISTNQFASKENRNEEITPKFDIYDPIAQANKSREIRKIKRKAYQAAIELSDDRAKKILKLANIPVNERFRDVIESFAENKTADFNILLNSIGEEVDLVALIKRANEELPEFSIEASTKTVIYEGDVIYQWEGRRSNEDMAESIRKNYPDVQPSLLEKLP